VLLKLLKINIIIIININKFFFFNKSLYNKNINKITFNINIILIINY
jgi:purine-cytosine permease-like protein